MITEAPNVMWAIHAMQVTTVRHGKVWLFGLARDEARHPLRSNPGARMAVRQQFGHLSAGAARGLAVGHDHGSAFVGDRFENQVRFSGISPSYAFVAEPETNGVNERVFRTLKEQIIQGRVFQTIDEVREAVRDFAARCNADWLIEKNGYLSPLDARAAHLDTNLSRAA
jgi:transposase InsO family protein